jgi:hypothetical protein
MDLAYIRRPWLRTPYTESVACQAVRLTCRKGV